VETLDNLNVRDFIKLLLFSGLRRNEGAALRWDEIDFATKTIRLPAKRLKNSRKLDLPMTSFVRDLLVVRRAIGNDHGWVFGAHSRSGHLEEPSSAFDVIAEKTGIRISSHDLRRTYITVAESCDISPLALKALVNHALGNNVTEGYVIMLTERLRQPAQLVTDHIAQLCGINRPDSQNVVQIVG
jgi:integrase